MIKKFVMGMLLTYSFSQDICEEFHIISFDFNPDTEWGNLLLFYVDVPDTSIYAPYFFLQTDDEFLQITDSIASYFWVTGPTTIDLLYHFEYDSIPGNHPFLGMIQMVSGDDQLTCEFQFEFIVNEQILMGDVNLDNDVNVLDIVFLVIVEIDQLLLLEEQYIAADMNADGDINIIDIVLIVNIILLVGLILGN